MENYMVNEIQISYKRAQKDSRALRTSEDSAKVLKAHIGEFEMDYRESFWVIGMNPAGKVTGIRKISEGGLNSCVVDIRAVFQTALLTNSTRIILGHNHPSGSLQPSGADIAITRKIQEAGKLLDIEVLDHVIVTTESYYSFADEGLI